MPKFGLKFVFTNYKRIVQSIIIIYQFVALVYYSLRYIKKMLSACEHQILFIFIYLDFLDKVLSA